MFKSRLYLKNGNYNISPVDKSFILKGSIFFKILPRKIVIKVYSNENKFITNTFKNYNKILKIPIVVIFNNKELLKKIKFKINLIPTYKNEKINIRFKKIKYFEKPSKITIKTSLFSKKNEFQITIKKENNTIINKIIKNSFPLYNVSISIKSGKKVFYIPDKQIILDLKIKPIPKEIHFAKRKKEGKNFIIIILLLFFLFFILSILFIWKLKIKK